MQKNIYKSDGGGWVVEFRHDGDRQWTRVGVFGCHAAAMRVYRKL